MNAKVKYWIELAEYDLITAEAMLDAKRYLYVGFMCHQVIEKALKSALVSKFPEVYPPKIHNLHRLAEQAQLLSELNDSQKELLLKLEPLNIQARYPEHKEALSKSLTGERCKELISQTKELKQWIISKL